MTYYDEVYENFKDKITDPDLLVYTAEIQEEILEALLLKACSRFKRVCAIDLSDRDDILKGFNVDLDDETMDILSEIMVEYWLKPYVNNVDNLRNTLNTKDFSSFSPANLLNAIQNTYDTSCKRSNSEINKYSFIYGDIENLHT